MRALLALLLLVATGRAQPSPQPTISIEGARASYERGAQLYEAGRYEEALVEFRRSFAISNRPALLFNIARCLEQLGRLQEGVAALRLYLARDPYLKDRFVVEKKARELEGRILEARRAVERRNADEARHRLRRGVTIGLWTATGALALGAVGLTVGAAANHAELSSSCPARDASCSPGALDQLRALGGAADGMWAVTGAAAVVSTVLTIVWWRR